MGGAVVRMEVGLRGEGFFLSWAGFTELMRGVVERFVIGDQNGFL